MPASIFSGTKVKLLKKVAQLFTGAEIHSSATDPTSSAVSAPIGSLLLNETTGNVYRKLDAGSSTNWSLLGAGSGDGVNLMKLDSSFKETKPQNADFELSIGDWVAYADAAATMPVDMTGGSPNTTIARSTSTPLNGAAHALMTITTGASRQGEGVSCVVNIPPAYRGRTLQLSFPFQTTGTLVEDDFRLFVYDITNSVVITPFTSGKILGSSGTAQCSFHASTNTASVRVGIHIARTSTGAATILFDDVSLSSRTTPVGLAGSDWNAFEMIIGATTTPPTKGTIVIDDARWRRVGDTMHIMWNYQQTTGGSAGSGTYLFPIPNGLSVDTAKLTPTTTVEGSVVGAAGIYNTAMAYAKVYNSTNLALVTNATGVGAATFISSSLGAIGSGAKYSFEAFVPISGWSSNVSMAESSTFLISSYLANGTRVTGTAPTKLGEYRSYRRNASATTFTETNGAPSAPPTAANGVRIYNGNAWGVADTNNEPTRYEIFVGKNKNVQTVWYANTGRTGFIDTSPFIFSTTNDIGYYKYYDPTTGILTVTSALYTSSGRTAHYSGIDDTGSNTVQDPYFDIQVSENALAVGTQHPRSYIMLGTPNNFGSTNTKIIRWTSAITNVGPAMTYADSATGGTSITINEDGIYSISFALPYSTTGRIGISRNSNQLTTDIQSITTSHILVASDSGTNGVTIGGSWTGFLAAGDVIRNHAQGGILLNQSFDRFIISKVSN